LGKDSNFREFTAWDVRGRLEDVEAMYSALKDTMSGTALERHDLEEAVTRYKARCECTGLSSNFLTSLSGNLGSHKGPARGANLQSEDGSGTHT
jgi:hypothetical protein